jgi:hypothetical protein
MAGVSRDAIDTVMTAMKSICFRALLPFLVALQMLPAQILVDLRTQTKSIDFSAATSTKPFQTGTVLPATCMVGAAYFNSAAPAGKNLLMAARLPTRGRWRHRACCSEAAQSLPATAPNSIAQEHRGRGAPCTPTTMVTMASPFTVAGSLHGVRGSRAAGSREFLHESRWNAGLSWRLYGICHLAGRVGHNTRQILAPNGPLTNRSNHVWADATPTGPTLMKIGAPSAGASSLGPAIPDTDYVTPSGMGMLQNKTFDATSMFSNYLSWSQISTPSAPASGYLRVYAKVGSGRCTYPPDGGAGGLAPSLASGNGAMMFSVYPRMITDFALASRQTSDTRPAADLAEYEGCCSTSTCGTI